MNANLLVGLLLLAAAPAHAGVVARDSTGRTDLRSDRRYIESHAGAGLFAYYPIYFEEPTLGVDFYVSLRPSAARFFYPGFARHNIGMAFGVTYLELAGARRFVDATVVFRRYSRRLDERPSEDSPFFGVGFGVVGIAWDTESVGYHDVSIVGEVGYEYRSVESLMLTFRLQARRLAAGPISFSGVSFVASVGWRTD